MKPTKRKARVVPRPIIEAPSRATPDEIKALYPKLFTGSFTAGAACDICHLYVPKLMRLSKTDAEFEQHLSTLLAFGTQSFISLLLFGETMKTLNGQRRLKVISDAIDGIVKVILHLEQFKDREVKKRPMTGNLMDGTITGGGPLHVIAMLRKEWPAILTPSKQSALQCHSRIVHDFRLGEIYHRSFPQLKKGITFERKIAERLHDEIHRLRLNLYEGKIASAAWNLKCPTNPRPGKLNPKALAAKKWADWWDVAKQILRSWFGDNISAHKEFAAWKDRPRFKNSKYLFVEGKPGILNNAIVNEIQSQFVRLAPKYLIEIRSKRS